MQLLNEDNISLPERLVLEKVELRKLKKEQEIRFKNGQGIKVQRLVRAEVYIRRESEDILY